jgi:hypothetical protein
MNPEINTENFIFVEREGADEIELFTTDKWIIESFPFRGVIHPGSIRHVFKEEEVPGKRILVGCPIDAWDETLPPGRQCKTSTVLVGIWHRNTPENLARVNRIHQFLNVPEAQIPPDVLREVQVRKRALATLLRLRQAKQVGAYEPFPSYEETQADQPLSLHDILARLGVASACFLIPHIAENLSKSRNYIGGILQQLLGDQVTENAIKFIKQVGTNVAVLITADAISRLLFKRRKQ